MNIGLLRDRVRHFSATLAHALCREVDPRNLEVRASRLGDPQEPYAIYSARFRLRLAVYRWLAPADRPSLPRTWEFLSGPGV
jgi:hypothetical protein